MDFEVGAALVAGLAATAVMTAGAAVLKYTGRTDFSLLRFQGSAVVGTEPGASIAGAVLHFGVFGTVLFGFAYAGLFQVLDASTTDAFWVGAAIGIVHGIVTGIALAAVPYVHPRMAPPDPNDMPFDPVGPRGAQAETDAPLAASTEARPQLITRDPELRLRAPGFFGWRWGALAPGAVVALHVVYGLVYGLVYAWIV